MLEFGRLFGFTESGHLNVEQKAERERQLETRLEEVFTLERSLSLATRPAGEDRNATVWYNKMSLAEFTQRTGNFINFTDYMNELAGRLRLPYRFTPSESVVVRDVTYYQQMARILADTPPLTMYNYLAYRLAWDWASAADGKMREFAYKYSRQKTGAKEMAPLWKDCLGSVGGWAASRLYVDHFVLPGTKERATEMVDDLREAFVQETLKKDVDWLDGVTRERALEKAARTHFYVAYPDWILNNSALDAEVYRFTETDYVKVKEGHYFESVLETTRRSIAVHFMELHRKPNVQRDFLAPPSAVNAFAAHAKNAIGKLFPVSTVL